MQMRTGIPEPNVFIRRLLVIVIAIAAQMALLPGAHAEAPKITERNLPNALRLRFIERNELPVVNVRVVVDAGSKYDPSGKAGLANVTAQTLLAGYGESSAAEFQRYLDSIGASANVIVNRDAIILNVTIPRRDLFSGLDVLRRIISEPSIEPGQLQTTIRRQISRIYQWHDVGWPVMDDYAYEALYPDQAIAHNPLGVTRELRSITTEDVRDYFNKFFIPSRINIILSGDIESSRSGNQVATQFSTYMGPKEDKTKPIKFEPRGSIDLRIILMDMPGGNGATIGLYALGEQVDNINAFGAQIMLTHLLGGDPGLSFLGRELMNQQSLINSLESDVTFSKIRPMTKVTMRCGAEHVTEVVTEIVETLKLLRESRISIRELDDGKRYFKGLHDLYFETAWDAADRAEELTVSGLPLTGQSDLIHVIDELTQEDIRANAERLFSNENLALVIFGDASVYESQLEEFGRISIRSAKLPSE